MSRMLQATDQHIQASCFELAQHRTHAQRFTDYPIAKIGASRWDRQDQIPQELSAE